MKNLSNKKLFISLGIGIIGVIFLIISFLYWYGGPTEAYPYPPGMLGFFKKVYHSLMKLSTFTYILLSLVGQFGFLISFFLSPVGIFLAVKSLNSPQRKLAIFAIVLNSINLIFALFIAWLLFGLARGM
jgi:hypothetical protein